MNNNQTEPIYATIDLNIKDRAALYCTESRLTGKKDTVNLRSLIEIALVEYMKNNPIRAKQEKQE